MNARQFYDTVVKMREAQKEYFKYRMASDLKSAKITEKVIDDEIKRVNKLIANKGQLTIFGKRE